MKDRTNIKEDEFDQMNFDQIIMNFMVNGMHYVYLLDDPTFYQLLNGILFSISYYKIEFNVNIFFFKDMASRRIEGQPRELKYKLITQDDFHTRINEMAEVKCQEIQSCLAQANTLSLSADVCKLSGIKYLIVIAAHWINPITFGRESKLVVCEKTIASSVRLISQRISDIYINFGITEKALVTVTYNITDAIISYCESLEKSKQATIHYVDVINTKLNVLQNPAYILKLIAADVVNVVLKSNNLLFAQEYRRVIGKLMTLKTNEKANVSTKANRIRNDIFNLPLDCSKSLGTYNQIAKLLTYTIDDLNELCEELYMPFFGEQDLNFLKGCNDILEPIASGIDYLERDDCYFAAYLPIIHSIIGKLSEMQKSPDILPECVPLLDATHHKMITRFSYFLNFDDEKCKLAIVATCTHPFFKLRWLKGIYNTKANNTKIMNILLKASNQFENEARKKIGDEGTSSQSTSNKSKTQPIKKFKFNFETSVDKSPEESISTTQVDLMSFLKKPCSADEDDFEQIKYHPCVNRLFIRYNSIPCSSSVFNHLRIPLQGKQYNDLFIMSA